MDLRRDSEETITDTATQVYPLCLCVIHFFHFWLLFLFFTVVYLCSKCVLPSCYSPVVESAFIQVLKYNFEVLVLYLRVFIFCYFILVLLYITVGNVVLFTPLHVFNSD